LSRGNELKGPKLTLSLLALLRFFKKFTAAIDQLKVHCREQNRNDKRYRRPEKVQNDLAQALQAVHENPTVRVLKYDLNRGFHDRTLVFTVVDASGCTVKRHYDLTGGIDYLMDQTQETKLFRYQVTD